MSSDNQYIWWKDYRVYIALFALIKCYHLNIPVLDEHNRRQCLTLVVARNFVEIDPNILYPRSPICDSRTGIIPQEFPILNYLIALLFLVFGEQNWVFRILMVLSTSFGLVAFYQYTKNIINKEVAFFSLLLFASSIAFAYSRKAMPDIFAISLCLGALYYGYQYLSHHKIRYLLLYLFLSTLGLLTKMPAAVVLCLLLHPMLEEGFSVRRRMLLLIVSIFPLTMLYLWYFNWVPYLESEFGFKLYYTQSFADGWQEIVELGSRTYERFTPILFQNHVHFYASIAGLGLLIYNKKWRLMTAILASALVSLFFIVKTGKVFANHEYYILPLIPFMCILAALLYAQIKKWKPFVWMLIGILSVISLQRQWHHMSIKENLRHFEHLSGIVDRHIPRESRILINSIHGNPMPLYMAHRRGWLNTEKYLDTLWLAGERTVGLEYMVLLKERLPENHPFQNPLYEDDNFALYKNEYTQ